MPTRGRYRQGQQACGREAVKAGHRRRGATTLAALLAVVAVAVAGWASPPSGATHDWLTRRLAQPIGRALGRWLLHPRVPRNSTAGSGRDSAAWIEPQHAAVVGRVVYLTWLVRDSIEGGATVLRGRTGYAWERRGTVGVDSLRRIQFRDSGLVRGECYAYELLVRRGGKSQRCGRQEVTRPGEPALRVMRVSSNPCRGPAILDVVVAEAGPLSVDVFDVSGRRVEHGPASGGTGGRGRLRSANAAVGDSFLRIRTSLPSLRPSRSPPLMVATSACGPTRNGESRPSADLAASGRTMREGP